MANYPKIMTTYDGLALISETVASSKALVFTKIVLGDGDIEDQDFRALTDLLSPKMTLPVTGGADIGNGQVQIRAAVSNSALETGFFAKEVGVYAKSGNDGTEKLIAYTNGGNYVDYIPDKSTPIDSQVFKVDVVVGNASNVIIQVKDETFITKAELDDHNSDPDAHTAAIDKHNKDENAHNGILQKVATLGESVLQKLALTTTISAINALQTNSWFGQLLKMVLTASGVRYNIEQNGYICLGSFFGNLIIQWGIAAPTNSNNKYADQNFPITFTTAVAIAASWDIQEGVTTAASTTTVTWNRQGTSLSKIRLITDTTEIGIIGFLAIGR